MNTQGNKQATTYSNVGIDARTAIEVRLAARDTEVVEIHIGYGPELVIDCDVESVERLRDVAVEGTRLLRKRIEENGSAAAQVQELAGEAGQLVGAEVAR